MKPHLDSRVMETSSWRNLRGVHSMYIGAGHIIWSQLLHRTRFLYLFTATLADRLQNVELAEWTGGIDL